MYGKIFGSMFTGSMVGSGAIVFAVWSYVIAMMEPGKESDGGMWVELNPKYLAPILGEDEGDVAEVIEGFCQPDKDSRSQIEGGRKLLREGKFLYRVVNGIHYREIRNQEERREYQRRKQKEYRERKARLKKGTPLAGEMLYERTGQEPHEFREVAAPYPAEPVADNGKATT